MRRLFTILIAIFAFFTATAQEQYSIILDQSTFRKVNSDALTGVNIDPIAKDASRNACARLKIKFKDMSRAEVDALAVKFQSNTDIARQEVAPYFDNVLILEMTAKPNTRFYVQSPDYGQSNEVTLNLEGDCEYEMEARLNQTFSIVVNSNVEGAEVYIDGKMKGRTGANWSLTVSEVTIGSHTLKVVYGGVSSEQKIEVNKNSISFRQDVDTAASEPQFVIFNVEPATAVVSINNNHYPMQDGSMSIVLASGTYSYTVTAVGYHPQNGTFTVAGSTVEKSLILTADSAKVSITVADNAEIWINGTMKGTGRWSGTLNSGAYIFEARKAGCKSTKISKQISSSTATQSITLPAPSPIVGTLIVASTPVGASVSIDNKPAGTTPLKLNNIFVGSHTLKLTCNGYGDYAKNITVTEGKTTTVNATLTKQVTTASASTPRQTPSSDSSNIAGFEMVFVKGGTFTMGATAEQGSEADSDEKPTHSVTLSDYYIGKYEVTQAQWRAVMGSNPSRFTGDNNPVEKVSWNDVQEFIEKLNAQTGKNFRLPTEAEWEYAARGGNKSKKYKYSGSNSISDVAWYSDNSSGKTHPVGQKTPNELGIYDMSGNVDEWCQDWFGSYSSESQTNPTGPSSGSYRVRRGGGWLSYARRCRVSYRSLGRPDDRDYYYGFRLALAGGAPTPTHSTPSQSGSYKIGDLVTVNGVQGIVFQASPVVKIVSVEETTARWGVDEWTINATDRDNGKVNMAKIESIPGWQSKYPAFKWCADLGDGWYLPALKELEAIYAQRDKINRALSAKVFDSLGSKLGFLWSSTEYSNYYAYILNFSSGSSYDSNKYTTYNVRAVLALD